MKRKRVAILGSTGSIGLNTLDVIRRYPDRFEVALLAARNNVAALRGQIKEFAPGKVALAGDKIPQLRGLVSSSPRFFDVEKDLSGLVAGKDVDVVVLAMTGAVALQPFLSAVKAGKAVAPANKEALVMAGDVIMAAARKSGARIIPVDSEQSAIFQCLQGQRRCDLTRVHLTASGGPLWNVPVARYNTLTVDDVLRHPRWSMGAKITVDSATLMNKGLEVIEAQRLFGLTTDQVHVVVHPQAIVHSMVEYQDGSMIAQLGVTDMRIPIQYALTYPERLPTAMKGVDLVRLGALTFLKPDMKRFPALALAYHASREGGTVPAVLNAADEVAVEAFLGRKIKFMSIVKIVEKVVKAHHKVGAPSLEDVQHADTWARAKAEALIKG